MTVPTLTKKQADLREQPGGGKLHPVRHIVRIVVVPSEPGSRSMRQSGGSGQSDELTDGELEAAAAALKKMPAPSSSKEKSAPQGSSNARSTNPTMFDVLEPTDIVVVGRKPASVLESARTRRVFSHDEHHADTVLRVCTESDTIEYQCDEPFEIVGVERAGWKIHDAPDNPFGFGEVKYIAQERKSDTDKKPIWVWTSGLLPARANNQQYKATFKIRGKLVDPDVVCGDPPPSA